MDCISKLASGGRVTNGELVTVKSLRSDGGIELSDGRVLDKSFRQFLPGYAVTSYSSQGKTVDYALFSDSTIKAATNAQQWYVSATDSWRCEFSFKTSRTADSFNASKSTQQKCQQNCQQRLFE